jgi:hypothetical protein
MFQKPIPQLCIFCLIHGINNYVEINTYWRWEQDKSPPIMMKSKTFFFLYTFFYIDGDIRYIIKVKGGKIEILIEKN